MKNNEPWTVYGLVVGERLPSKQVRIAHIYLGPKPMAATPINHVARPVVVGAPYSRSCSIEHADMAINSDCFFWLRRKADTAQDAIALVEREDLPLLQAALSIRCIKQPYRFTISLAERGDVNESAPSSGASYTGFETVELPDEAIALAGVELEIFKNDSAATLAAQRLYDAIRQRDTSWAPRDQEAALLSAFKVIEAMAGALPIQVPADLERNQKSVIHKLEKLLQTQKAASEASAPETVSTCVKAIKTASDELARLETNFLGLKITGIAKRLNLTASWEKATLDFLHFRNRRLGHAAQPTSKDERAPWLDESSATSALPLARQLLVAYAEFKQKEKNVRS